jgi:hypothetical protein
MLGQHAVKRARGNSDGGVAREFLAIGGIVALHAGLPVGDDAGKDAQRLGHEGD